MRRGSPMKMAAAIFFCAAAEMGMAVLVIPSLESPPPQYASSKIWPPYDVLSDMFCQRRGRRSD
jgi:hypothetical protein